MELTVYLVHYLDSRKVRQDGKIVYNNKCYNVSLKALSEGKKAYFVNAISLIERLKKAYIENRFENTLRYFKSLDLFIIDELGYLPLDSEGAKLFFELVSQRYEKGSIIVTSNRSFTEWDKIFTDSVLATAVLDTLLHHSIVINIRGKSYRLKEKQKNGLIGAIKGGVIDHEYRGEVLVLAKNRSESSIILQPGQKIAQMLIVPVWTGQPARVDRVDINTVRKDNGFGSTGE